MLSSVATPYCSHDNVNVDLPGACTVHINDYLPFLKRELYKEIYRLRKQRDGAANGTVEIAPCPPTVQELLFGRLLEGRECKTKKYKDYPFVPPYYLKVHTVFQVYEFDA